MLAIFMIATTAQAAHVCTTQALLANGASQSMGAEVTPVRVCLLCLMAAACQHGSPVCLQDDAADGSLATPVHSHQFLRVLQGLPVVRPSASCLLILGRL
jgi:hypothetical protein